MNQNLEKPITIKDLSEFTEEVILPGVERMVKDSEERIGRRMDGFDCKFNEVMKTLKEMQKSIERLEVKQDKERLEIRVIDWLIKRVDVLEKRFGVVPEPMPPT